MEKSSNFIVKLLDVFYPIFKKLMPKQTYYYAVCGGGNALLSFIIYFFAYHNLLHKQDLDLGFYAMKPHIASYFISFLSTFPIGFLLSKYVVWPSSNLKGKHQLFRHLLSVVIFVVLNYLILKLFVEVFMWWPLPSQILTTTIIIVFSYLSQKYYSFKH